MGPNDRNSTRAGRSIESLDDRAKGANGGAGDRHGNRMPQYDDEEREERATESVNNPPGPDTRPKRSGSGAAMK